MTRELTLVSGAARGIGLAIARERVASGRRVAMLDVDADVLARAAEALGGGCAELARVCDVSNAEDVERTLSRFARDGFAITELVNNAGIGGPFEPLDEVTDATWRDVFETNVRGLFLMCRLVLPRMREAGRGRIVNVASVQGLVGAPLSSTYVASKHAVVGYTRAIAAEWGPFGITCNAVCPGYVDTRMGVQEDARPGHRDEVLRRIPAGRLARPSEIADAVAFLLAPGSGYVNGVALVVDGAMSAVT